jgi:hypothetical protein
MKLTVGVSNEGISLSLGSGNAERLTRNPAADQLAPRRSYVYGHFDERGIPFYIGKGTGHRAWEDDRHPLWHRYVEKHLNGKYSVIILEDNLTPEHAEQAESAWIAQESETLVNWINMSRRTDFDALNKFHRLRNATLELMAQAKGKEKDSPDNSIALYYKALEQLSQYASIQSEFGLIGQLLGEETLENGLHGELQILDRLTLCLVRADRGTEAAEAAERYFAAYRADLKLAAAEKINKRVGKAVQNAKPSERV